MKPITLLINARGNLRADLHPLAGHNDRDEEEEHALGEEQAEWLIQQIQAEVSALEKGESDKQDWDNGRWEIWLEETLEQARQRKDDVPETRVEADKSPEISLALAVSASGKPTPQEDAGHPIFQANAATISFAEFYDFIKQGRASYLAFARMAQHHKIEGLNNISEGYLTVRLSSVSKNATYTRSDLEKVRLIFNHPQARQDALDLIKLAIMQSHLPSLTIPTSIVVMTGEKPFHPMQLALDILDCGLDTEGLAACLTRHGIKTTKGKNHTVTTMVNMMHVMSAGVKMNPEALIDKITGVQRRGDGHTLLRTLYRSEGVWGELKALAEARREPFREILSAFPAERINSLNEKFLDNSPKRTNQNMSQPRPR
jgi:hypothetical protein